MLRIVTGVLGAGKTQYAIKLAREVWAEHVKLLPSDAVMGQPDEAQPGVYYHGIKGLRVPGWVELPDPADWMAVPDGSVVVIDEAWQFFKPLMPMKEKPPHYEQIATSRHRGIDLILVTQFPGDLDTFVRRRCGEHIHLSRTYGQDFTNVYKWQGKLGEVSDTGVEYHSAQAAERSTWRLDPEIWKLYDSAVLHTHTKKWPRKLLFIPALVVVVVGLIYWLFATLRSFGEVDELEPVVLDGSAVAASVGASGGFSMGSPAQSREQARRAYIERWTPLVDHVPWSAPAYDEARQVVSYPRPQCIASAVRCECYTQQATRLHVPEAECRRIVRYGYFDAAQPDVVSRSETYLPARETGGQALAGSPRGPVWTVIGEGDDQGEGGDGERGAPAAALLELLEELGE